MTPPTWHVEGGGIVQTTTLARGGSGIIDVYNVPYMIDSGPAAGHQGSVQIAATAYNPETVKAAIQAQVSAVHDVASLAG